MADTEKQSRDCGSVAMDRRPKNRERLVTNLCNNKTNQQEVSYVNGWRNLFHHVSDPKKTNK